jgi:hypothetical protein
VPVFWEIMRVRNIDVKRSVKLCTINSIQVSVRTGKPRSAATRNQDRVPQKTELALILLLRLERETRQMNRFVLKTTND